MPDDDLPPLLDADRPAPPERSLRDDIRQLAGDGRTAVEAEIIYQASRVKVAAGSVGKIAAFGLIAVLFVFFTLIALVVGLIMALAPYLTYWGATAVVALTLAGLAFGAVVIAKARLRRLIAAVFDPERH